MYPDKVLVLGEFIMNKIMVETVLKPQCVERLVVGMATSDGRG